MPAESEFVAIALKVGAQVLPQPRFHLRRSANLLYEITIDNELAVRVDPRKPMRGSSAFQTDLCVFEEKTVKGVDEPIQLPRVVLEFKTSITTHDVLTYSAKAKRHKQIYPYLRYGILASADSVVPKRFFSHNESLDFFAAVGGLDAAAFEAFFASLLTAEIESSQVLEDLTFGVRNRPRVFRSVPELAYRDGSCEAAHGGGTGRLNIGA